MRRWEWFLMGEFVLAYLGFSSLLAGLVVRYGMAVPAWLPLRDILRLSSIGRGGLAIGVGIAFLVTVVFLDWYRMRRGGGKGRGGAK